MYSTVAVHTALMSSKYGHGRGTKGMVAVQRAPGHAVPRGTAKGEQVILQPPE